MTRYLKKLRDVASQLEAERGAFTLFGLFMREDSPGQWDLVLSAPWLEKGKLRALGEFVEVLTDAIGQDGVFAFSRIVTLNGHDPALRAILREVPSTPLPFSKQGHNLFGLPIEEVYILRAKTGERARKKSHGVSSARRSHGTTSR